MSARDATTAVAVSVHEPADDDAHQYLAFTLLGETYGIDLLSVREIIGYSKPTPLPGMPEFMLGVINLRDHAVPVIDLARRFGPEATQVHQRSCVIFLESSGQELGVVVDKVNAVEEFSAQRIVPPPGFGTGLRRKFIKGMAEDGDGFTILLDIQRVFSTDELAAMGATPALNDNNDARLAVS